MWQRFLVGLLFLALLLQPFLTSAYVLSRRDEGLIDRYIASAERAIIKKGEKHRLDLIEVYTKRQKRYISGTRWHLIYQEIADQLQDSIIEDLRMGTDRDMYSEKPNVKTLSEPKPFVDTWASHYTRSVKSKELFSGATITTAVATLAHISEWVHSLLLIPGIDELEVARFNLTIREDASRLTDLYVYDLQSDGTFFVNQINTVTLNIDWRVPINGRVLNNGVVHFAVDGQKPISFLRDTSIDLVVRASFKDLSDIGQSWRKFQLGLWVGNNNIQVATGTVSGLRLVSENTKEVVTKINGYAFWKMHLLAWSRPNIMLSSSGEISSHSFTIRPEGSQYLTINKLIFSLDNPARGPTAWSLYAAGIKVWNGNLAEGTNLISVDTSNHVISSGIPQVFRLEVEGWSVPTRNARRVFKILDINYWDHLNWNTSKIVDVWQYHNVGISWESSFSY